MLKFSAMKKSSPGWVGGSKSSFKDCLHKSKTSYKCSAFMLGYFEVKNGIWHYIGMNIYIVAYLKKNLFVKLGMYTLPTFCWSPLTNKFLIEKSRE